jgi:hypothetical protein
MVPSEVSDFEPLKSKRFITGTRGLGEAELLSSFKSSFNVSNSRRRELGREFGVLPERSRRTTPPKLVGEE